MPEKLIAIAYYSDFMTKEQFREQAETGIVQLKYAVPEYYNHNKRVFTFSVTVGVESPRFDCSAWHNNTKVDLQLLYTIVTGFHTAMYYIGYRYIKLIPSNNGLHQLKCKTIGSSILEQRVKSVNLTFVKGQSQPLSAELTINLSSPAQIQPSLFLLRLCSLLNNLRETLL